MSARELETVRPDTNADGTREETTITLTVFLPNPRDSSGPNAASASDSGLFFAASGPCMTSQNHRTDSEVASMPAPARRRRVASANRPPVRRFAFPRAPDSQRGYWRSRR
jgi:hypothetical protein